MFWLKMHEKMYSLFEVSLLLLLTLHLTLSFVVNPVDTSASWSFDPNSDVGPPKWSSIQTNTTNECDGLEQSPIDITIPGPCTATNRTFELNVGIILFVVILFSLPSYLDVYFIPTLFLPLTSLFLFQIFVKIARKLHVRRPWLWYQSLYTWN